MSKNVTTVADFLVNQLAAWGVDRVFGVPGDTVLSVIEALAQDRRIQFVSTRHEGAAALMASAYAKMTGRIGACLADTGPGSIQLMTGVYDAHRDRVPMFVITGEVETRQRGTGWPQDVDLGLAYQDCTAYNRTVFDPEQAPKIVQEGLRQALLQSGPARVGIPKNLWRESVPDAMVQNQPDYLSSTPPIDYRLCDAAAHILNTAERPVIFAGQGARKAVPPLLQLADTLTAGVVHSLPAIGAVPRDHALNLGVVGDFGTQAAADALGSADAVLVVGSTWWQPEYVPRGAKVIQVDSKRAHLGMLFPAAVGIAGQAEDVIPELQKRVQQKVRQGWQAFLQEARQGWDQECRGDGQVDGAGGVSPRLIIGRLQKVIPQDAIVVLDVGNNTFWFSRYFQGQGQRVVISGHWRAVGFALPAAIAAQLAYPDKPVVALTGDGGLGMYLAEFTTAVRHKLPIRVVVLKDGVWGEEWSLQEKWGLDSYGVEFHNPDFARFAEACGGAGLVAGSAADFETRLRAALQDGRPSILEVTVPRTQPQRPQPLAAKDQHPRAMSEFAKPDGGGGGVGRATPVLPGSL